MDVVACDTHLQPLGYLAWAACGKDPGFTPLGILELSRRSTRYSAEEVSSLAFDGTPPRAADLSRRWRDALEVAAAVIDRLPDAHVGQAVLTPDARLFTGGAAALEEALANERLVFHRGRLGGALPQLKA